VTTAREVLHEELDRYTIPVRGNNHQVHPSTKEIPNISFRRAIAEGNTLFQPFSIPKPYTSSKDIFCLRERRIVNAYRRISIFNNQIQVLNVVLFKEVSIHMMPNTEKQVMELRI